jgi:hypothetical protein
LAAERFRGWDEHIIPTFLITDEIMVIETPNQPAKEVNRSLKAFGYRFIFSSDDPRTQIKANYFSGSI